jgi:hypothetical protein
LISQPLADFAIHLSAGIIGEADALLSSVRSTACGGASEARVLDRGDRLATIRRRRMKGKLQSVAIATVKVSPRVFSSDDA